MYLNLEEVLRPRTIEACLDLLGAPTTAVVAGGTWLNARDQRELRRLVDIQALPLRGLDITAERVRLGALVTLTELAEAPLPQGLAALRDVAVAEHNLPTRNRSTVGGRLARRLATGRLATALVALDAEVEVVERRSGGGAVHRLPVADYLWQREETARGQLLLAVEIPDGACRSAYSDLGRTAVDAPIADAALRHDEGACRLATGGHGPDASGVVALAAASEIASAFDPRAMPPNWRRDIGEAMREAIPSWDDARASGEYRRELAITLVLRLIEACLAERGRS